MYGFNNNFQPQVIFAYVNGFDGAKAYQLPMNCKALLMDTSEQKFFWKEYSSQTGQASITPYVFYAEMPAVKKEATPQEAPLTRSDIEEIVKSVIASNKKSKEA